MMKNTKTKRDKTAPKNNRIGDKIDMTYIPFHQRVSQMDEFIDKRDKRDKAASELEQILSQMEKESYTNMKKIEDEIVLQVEELRNKLIKSESELEQIRLQIEEAYTNKYEAQYDTSVINLMKAKHPMASAAYAANKAMNRYEDAIFEKLYEYAYKMRKVEEEAKQNKAEDEASINI